MVVPMESDTPGPGEGNGVGRGRRGWTVSQIVTGVLRSLGRIHRFLPKLSGTRHGGWGLEWGPPVDVPRSSLPLDDSELTVRDSPFLSILSLRVTPCSVRIGPSRTGDSGVPPTDTTDSECPGPISLEDLLGDEKRGMDKRV